MALKQYFKKCIGNCGKRARNGLCRGCWRLKRKMEAEDPVLAKKIYKIILSKK